MPNRYDSAQELYEAHKEFYPDGLVGCACGHCTSRLREGIIETTARIDWLLDYQQGIIDKMGQLLKGARDA